MKTIHTFFQNFSFLPKKKATLLLCLTCLTTLSACGRVGSPVAPGPDDKVLYPQPYPAE